MEYLIISGSLVIISYLVYSYKNKFDRFFRSIDFCNKDKTYPALLMKQKTEYGNDYTFSLPAGMNIEHWKKIQLSLEQYLNSRIRLEYKDNSIKVYSSEVKLNDLYPFKLIKSTHPCDIIIGFTGVGIKSIRLNKHMLICGSSGFGKSTLERAIITNLILNNNPENMVINLCDFSIRELAIFKKSNMVKFFATNAEELKEMLKTLKEESDGRFKLFEKNSVLDIEGYNAKSEKKLKYIVNFMDEISQLDHKKQAFILEELQRRMAIDRACGIFYCICTQRPSVDILPGSIRANIDIRVCFRTVDEGNSKIILDQSGAEQLTLPGRGLLRYNGGDLEEFHAMLLPENEAINLVKHTFREVEFVITDRDKRIIEHLKTKEADSKELHDLFFHDFSPQWANKRLKTLVDNGVIKRKKSFETGTFLYYL